MRSPPAVHNFDVDEILSSSKREGLYERWLTLDSAGVLFCVLCVAAIAIGCAITVKIGLPNMATYGHDTFIMLDGGWRALNGQRPGTDFYSALGPLSYLQTAAGLALASNAPVGVALVTAMTGIVLGLWTIALVRSRLPAWAGLLAVVFLEWFWLAPFPLGETYYLTSYAMQYNRLGYVLLSLIMLELFTHPSKNAGGWSTGVATALLLFLKVNFFVVAAVLIALSYLITSKTQRHLLYLLAGFAAVSLAMLWYLRWDCSALIRDTFTAALARQGRVRGIREVIRILTRNTTEIIGLIGTASMTWVYLSRERRRIDLRQSITMIAFVGAILVSDFILSLSNTQRAGFPLTLIAILLLSAQLGAGLKAFRYKSEYASSVALAFVALIMLLPTIVGTIDSWGMIIAERSRAPEKPISSVNTPILQGLLFDNHSDPTGLDHGSSNGELYTGFINEGLTMLTANSSSSDRIVCLCFSNAFPYALLRRPAKGGSPFFEYATNFTEHHAPSAKRILGNAEIVMYPNGRPAFSRLDVLLELCQAELTAHYRKLVQSENWTMYRRTS